MTDTLVPRPASTVVTLRDSPRGLEVLMVRRNLRSEFVGGAYVFPGGALDAGDADPIWATRARGLDDAAASSRLALASGGLAYFVAGLRELFEEAGLLIACDAHGDTVTLDDPTRRSRLAARRRELNAGATTLASVLVDEGLWLDLTRVGYLAHWVTPVGMVRRYDTRFLVAATPPGQVAAHDEGETVDSRWVRPREALEASGRGEMTIILPTMRTLASIADFTTLDEVLGHVRALGHVPRIEPRIVVRDGVATPVAPGDPGYDDAGD
jgi:8-oxo-dGTP pyrophosphatase MutT (NUDIX family)